MILNFTIWGHEILKWKNKVNIFQFLFVTLCVIIASPLQTRWCSGLKLTQLAEIHPIVTSGEGESRAFGSWCCRNMGLLKWLVWSHYVTYHPHISHRHQQIYWLALCVFNLYGWFSVLVQGRFYRHVFTLVMSLNGLQKSQTRNSP